MYREVPPPLLLRPLVECFWTLEAPPGAARREHRVLPDGCVDVIFDLGAARERAPAGPPLFVAGAMTRALVVERAGPAAVVAARFRPGGAAAFFGGAPLGEMRDRRVDLAELWMPAAGELRERAAAVPSVARGVALLEAELAARFAAAQDGRGPGGRGRRLPDPRVRAAAAYLAGGPDADGRAPTVNGAAAAVGLRRQHLARRFDAEVGLRPKEFARVARLRRLLAWLDARGGGLGGPIDWSAAAAVAGYYDQPT